MTTGRPPIRYFKRRWAASSIGASRWIVTTARAITSDGALALAERVRLNIERLSIGYHKHTFKVTVSIGVGTTNYGQVYSSVGNFLKAADDALYRAKAQGRNRSVSA